VQGSRLSGTDRNVAVGVLHGHLSGKRGTTRCNVENPSFATDRFIEHRLDNPQDKALTVMETMTD